ncbi:sulfate/molybdate ABC transporter ATP-binding protein [uncultured Oscillibacter sp.]|uniref:sulfate/molybdate ABC transporter ATP-binding protein n=1 Tax=uncultured Oscillibacter sp. TaxID=876091 RepID=UPI002609856D|nr:ATP-binding cassette domain-containing protein [uncultured Oscillibacter sp.]
MALTVQIQKRYGDFRLDVDFTAEDGQALALLGASGCGKSATLKCVAGIDRPDRGRIELDGQVLFDSEADIDLPPQRRRVGLLFQSYALFPNMTVERNIAVCLGRLDRRERRRRTAELLALLRLEEQAALHPRQLSGGQRQRAALARVLAAEPRALLLDEPFSALDSFLRQQLEEELRDLLDRFPGPVVWVSHDRGEACRNCPRVCVLEAGRSSPARGMAALMADPVTVSAARLSGCGNLVPARPGPGPGLAEVPAWGLTLRTAVPWRAGVTTLGFRANRVRPAEAGEVNAFPCRVVRAVEDAFSILVLLLPEGAEPEAPPLRMELPGEAWAALPDRTRLLASIRPEDLMLLE